jgi:predicted  nucleic acid-binding Zn-ribbon protein
MHPAVISALVSGGVALVVLLLGRYWRVGEQRDEEARKRLAAAPKIMLAEAEAAAHFRDELRAEVDRLRHRVENLEMALGEAAVREAHLEGILRTERDAWALQRADFLRRIRSLEGALEAAGVAPPRENGRAHG